MPKRLETSKTNRRDRPSTPLHVWLFRLAPYEVLGLIILMSLSMNTRLWLLEFVASYVPQLFIVVATYLLLLATVAAYVYIARGRQYVIDTVKPQGIAVMSLALLFSVFTLAQSLSILAPKQIPSRISQNTNNLTIGTFNKFYLSREFLRDSSSLTSSKVDIFALQEVDEDDITSIKELSNHQFSYTTDCDCSAADTELAIVSRYPIRNALTIYQHDNSAIIRTVIDAEDYGEFVVYAVHMHVPYEQRSYQLRDDTFQILEDAVAGEQIPTFVLGDMNTTIFSPDMQDFMNNSSSIENISSRVWPRCSWYGFGEAACARIDHVFTPANANVVGMEVGEQRGSDHRSVVVEIAI